MSVKHKIATLSGHALDFAVLNATGWELVRVGHWGTDDETPEQAELPDWFNKATDNSTGCYWYHPVAQKHMDAYWPEYTLGYQKPASPSTDWTLGGPLIEEYKVLWLPMVDGWVGAYCAGSGWVLGDTLLQAAMRAIVAHLAGGSTVSNLPLEVLT